MRKILPFIPPFDKGRQGWRIAMVMAMVFAFIGCDKPAKVDIGELVEAINGLDKDEVVDTDEINTDDDLLVCEEGEKRCESQWVMVCTGGEFVQSEHCVDCGPLCQCVESAGDAWCEHTDPGPDDADMADKDVVEAEPDEDLVEAEADEDLVEADLSAEAEAEADEDVVLVEDDLLTENEVEDDDVVVGDEVVTDDDVVGPFFIDGLVAWWKLDGNGDDFIGNYDTFSGTGYAFYSDTRTGLGQSANGQAVYTIPVTDYLDPGFTISVWAKYSFEDSQKNALADWTDASSSSDGNSLKIDGYDIQAMNYEGHIAANYAHNDRTTGVWYNYVVVITNGNRFIVYIDGVLVDDEDISTNPDKPNWNNVNKFIIGYTYGTPNRSSADAHIDDVMLFDRALTDLEVTKLFNAGSNGW
jgi:hypothetical protein